MSSFEQYFLELYGTRWQILKTALLEEPFKVDHPLFNGHSFYRLDPASLQVAESLPLKLGDLVLDMCAAPGGKALILLNRLGQLYEDAKIKYEVERLVMNELSFARRKKMEEIIRTHVPSAVQCLLKVGAWDGSQIGMKVPARFDKILVDAPCSSERHLLHQDPLMKEWKISRSKQLAQRQYALLCSALLSLKEGGVMVYSTCSISPLENDGVIERLLERKSDQVKLVEMEILVGEKTKYGRQIFPDSLPGQGPIYFSQLQKIPRALKQENGGSDLS